MLISLHKQATTTPKIRAAIQASSEPARVVAERYGISEQTVWKWRSRDGVHDRSHTPHRLQTTLTPAQEAVAVALRKTLLLPLDDLLSVVREFLNPHVSRSGLDRCLRRHGAGNLRALKPKEPKPAHGSFKAYEPGYLHIDIKYLPQMADEDRRRYLFVAIDRANLAQEIRHRRVAAGVAPLAYLAQKPGAGEIREGQYALPQIRLKGLDGPRPRRAWPVNWSFKSPVEMPADGLASQPTFRAMALMLSPCFFRSWIKTISLSPFT
jgi:transposase-like protein